MVWYKKQLEAKLKEIEEKKPKTEKEDSEKKAKPSFDPSKLKVGKNPFKNPVADMNRNRKKTDLPSA